MNREVGRAKDLSAPLYVAVIIKAIIYAHLKTVVLIQCDTQWDIITDKPGNVSCTESRRVSHVCRSSGDGTL